jgi:hypothetical protein
MPRRTALPLDLVALPFAAAMIVLASSSVAEPTPTYVGRPIYSDPSNGLQLPPTCNIEPTWRSRISGTEMEIWVLNCDSTPRAWLLTRQVVEMLSAREARLRFQVVDERILPGETVGDSLSVQCSGAGDTSGIIVYGARWRSAGRELRLASARGAMRADVTRRRLTDADPSGVDCVRFPDREAMMRKLQQPERSPR